MLAAYPWLSCSLAVSAAGAAFVASSPAASEGRSLCQAAAVAFAASLLVRAVAVGLPASRHLLGDPFFPLDTGAFAVALNDLGTVSFAVFAARVASRKDAWAATLEYMTVTAVVVEAMAQTGALCFSGVLWFAVCRIPPFVAQALLAVTFMRAWLALPSAPRETGLRTNGIGGACAAFPLVLGARWACVVGVWFGRQLPPLEERVISGFVANGCLLAIASLACMVRIALGPPRTPWSWVGPVLVACGELLSFRAATATFGHGALTVGTACFLVALAGLAGARGEGRHRGIDPSALMLVAGAVTMPAPPVDPALRLVLTLVALGCTVAATRLLRDTCIPLSRALLAGEARGREPAPAGEAAADFDETPGPLDDLPGLHRPSSVPASSGYNPYTAPASRSPRKRGWLGKRSLAPWRVELRQAIVWLVAPPVVLGVADSILVVLGGLSGNDSGTVAGYRAAAGRTLEQMAPLFVVSLPVARTLSLRGVFTMTRVSAAAPSFAAAGSLATLCRLAMTFAAAVQAAHAIVYLAYGAGASFGLVPWAVAADRLAYAGCAFYGARIFRWADRSAASLGLHFLGLAFAASAASYPVLHLDPTSDLVDTLVGLFLAAASATAGLTLRAALKDGDRRSRPANDRAEPMPSD